MSDTLFNDILFRGNFLKYSLLNESLTSLFLAQLLGIENSYDSKTLGFKSGSLSFNQKVDLLMDLQVLDADAKTKFQTFMEIRNQLVHNLSASTYEKCFGFLAGKDNWILKKYPQASSLSKEDALKNASISLAEDVTELVKSIIKSLQEKREKENQIGALNRKIEAHTKTVVEIQKIVELIVTKKLSKKSGDDSTDLKTLGEEVSEAFENAFHENYINILKSTEKNK